ncbi:hypothetical protein [Desulfobotulus alkaliphilus]|uniref:hypothetical protein n=1 Tax=Desulfobotulus alkaliphilus TaxID=622671 RepID=UPI0011A96C6F|nr:hypothetical protein [Desulfobotulus alkaliphilus]
MIWKMQACVLRLSLWPVAEALEDGPARHTGQKLDLSNALKTVGLSAGVREENFKKHLLH